MTMTSVYIVGGRRNPRGHQSSRGHTFEKALIAELELESGELNICFEYESPADVCPKDEPSILFKAAFLDGNLLYACTETEVMILRAPNFEQVCYVSLPCFNDVHFVRPTPNKNLLIANTGLDMVVEVTTDGQVVRQWDALGRPLWTRFSPDVDYRLVGSTKPHEAHPNYVFYFNDEIWVNRMRTRDVANLSDLTRTIPIHTHKNYDVAHCGGHDGIVFGDHVYFTTVNGHVVVADCATCKVVADYDLNGAIHSMGLLGWCRGIHVVDEQHVLVGFTRFRGTKHTENLSWLNEGLNFLKRNLLAPTRIALYNLPNRRVLWERNLEAVEMDAVFSLHVFQPQYPPGKSRELMKELVSCA